MTGFDSKRKIAQDRLDDDDVQVYAKPRLDQGPDYERGFVDGMMYQTQSSVNKAVNRMAQPAQEPVDNDFFKVLARNNPSPDQSPWVGLTDEETIDLAVKVGARLDLPPATKMQLQQQFIDALRKPDSLWMLFARDIEAKLKEKNFD